MKSGLHGDSAKEAASNYIVTMEFVKTHVKDYNDQGGGGKIPPVEDLKVNPKLEKNMKEIQLPLSADSWAKLSAPFPLSETTWTQMLAILNAMKPALVSAPNKPEPETK